MLNASRINMKRNFKKITFNTICLINMLICYLLWRDICKDISCNGIECLFSNPDAIFQYCIPNFIIDYKWRHMFGCQKKTSKYAYSTGFPPPDVHISSCQIRRFFFCFLYTTTFYLRWLRFANAFETEGWYLLWHLLTTIAWTIWHGFI